MAWPSPYRNCSSTLPEQSLCGHPAYLNPSLCMFPATVSALTAPATPNLKTEQNNEMQGFLQYPSSEAYLKETHARGSKQNANPAPLQKKLVILDHSGNRTMLFHTHVFPLVQSPIVPATQFAQSYDVNEEGKATNMSQKHPPKYSLPEESDKDHVVNDESEMHEDTEEINALLYSDDSDSDDEVTSTAHSPLATKRNHVIQQQFEDTKEEVASSDWPNKKQKLIHGGYNRFGYNRPPPPMDSAGSVKFNETSEYVSDAESKYSSGQVYSAEQQTKEDNSMVGNIQLTKGKIRESLRVLENLIPGAKGKHPLLIIDGTIEYLKSLMSQPDTTLGVKYH